MDNETKQHYKMYKSGKQWAYASLATITLLGGMGATPVVLAEEVLSEKTEATTKDAETDDKGAKSDATDTPVIATPDALPAGDIPAAPVEVAGAVSDTNDSKNKVDKDDTNPVKTKKATEPKAAVTNDADKTTKAKEPRAGYQLTPSDFTYNGTVITGFSDTFYTGPNLANWDGALIFPKGMETYTSIDKSAFSGAKNYATLKITSVDLSNLTGLILINSFAFSNSNTLTSLNISNLPSLVTIAEDAFYQNNAMTTLTVAHLPKLTAIPSWIVDCNPALTTVTFLDLPKVTSLGTSSNPLFEFRINQTVLKTINIGGMPLLTSITPTAAFKLMASGGVINPIAFNGDDGVAAAKLIRDKINANMAFTTRDNQWYIPANLNYNYIDERGQSIADPQAVSCRVDDVLTVLAPLSLDSSGFINPRLAQPDTIGLSPDKSQVTISTPNQNVYYSYTTVAEPSSFYFVDRLGNQLDSAMTITGGAYDLISLNSNIRSFTGYDLVDLESSGDSSSVNTGTWQDANNMRDQSLTLGVNNGRSYKFIYAKPGSVQYRYVDQNGDAITVDKNDTPVTPPVFNGHELDTYTTPAVPTIPGYGPGALTTNNEGDTIGAGNKVITYTFIAEAAPVTVEYVDIHGREIADPEVITDKYVNDILEVTQKTAEDGGTYTNLANYDVVGVRQSTDNPNVWTPIDAIPAGETFAQNDGHNFQFVYAKRSTVTQMFLDEAGNHIVFGGDSDHIEHALDDGETYDFTGDIPVIPGYGPGVWADDVEGNAPESGDATEDAQVVYYRYQTIAKPGTIYRVDTEGNTIAAPEEYGTSSGSDLSFISDALNLAATDISGYRYNDLWYTNDDPNDSNAEWQLYTDDLQTTLGASNGRSYKYVYAAATSVIHKYIDQAGNVIIAGTDNTPVDNFLQPGYVGDLYTLHDAPAIAGYGDPHLVSTDLSNKMTPDQLEVVYEYRTVAQPVTIYRTDTDGNDLGSETLTGHYTDEDLDLTPKQITGYDFKNLFGSAVTPKISRDAIPDLNWQAADALASTTLKYGDNAGRNYKFVYAKHQAANTDTNNKPTTDKPTTGTDTPLPVTGGDKNPGKTPTGDKTPGKLPISGGEKTPSNTGGTAGTNTGTPTNTTYVTNSTPSTQTGTLPKSGNIANRLLPVIGATLLASLIGLFAFIKKRKF